MASPLRAAPCRVLVVDDEDLVREVVARGLEDHGYSVQRASSAFSALDYLSQTDGGCEVIVTDLVMPRKSGAALGREACDRWPHLRVLYMTGYTRGELAQHGVPECPHAVLQKPFDAEELCREVDSLLVA